MLVNWVSNWCIFVQNSSMTINIIFQKDKGDTTLGYVYVNFRSDRVQKRISTRIKISKHLFVLCKNPHFPIFNATNCFDYEQLNNKIKSIIESVDVPKGLDFITFFESENDKLNNGGTKKMYTGVLKKLKGYHPVISFHEINQSFLRHYVELLSAENISSGYIRDHLIVICNNISKVNDEFGTKIFYDIKKLKLSTNKNRKDDLLTDDDINKLREFPIHHKNSEYVTFALMQLFGNGMRFSDLITLRYGNFKKEGVQIQQPKTKKHLKIPYSVMFLTVIYRYMFKDSVHTETELTNIMNMGFGNQIQLMDGLLKNILSEIERRKKNDFFFSFVPVDLINYNASRAYTDIEFDALHKSRSSYNGKLNVIRVNLKLSVNSLTSHQFRYKFVATCLELQIPIYEISKCLNHSSISVTELYVRKHFDYYDSKAVTNIVDVKYLGQPT